MCVCAIRETKHHPDTGMIMVCPEINEYHGVFLKGVGQIHIYSKLGFVHHHVYQT